jgi:hypothetical protein
LYLRQSYLSVQEYVDRTINRQSYEGYVTPIALADMMENNANHALNIIAAIQGDSPTLHCELADIRAWASLSLYFAGKLRAAAAYETYIRQGNPQDRQDAIDYLQTAAEQWET